MKKMFLLCAVAVFAVLLYATEMADIGINNLKNSAGAIVSVDTLAPSETLYTAIYAVDNVRGMSSNTGMFIKLDSLRDSTSCVIKLQESYDAGATWEYTTLVCSIATVAASIDTGFDVDLFPTPYLRFLTINVGKTTDSFTVETSPIFYNHPR